MTISTSYTDCFVIFPIVPDVNRCNQKHQQGTRNTSKAFIRTGMFAEKVSPSCGSQSYKKKKQKKQNQK